MFCPDIFMYVCAEAHQELCQFVHLHGFPLFYWFRASGHRHVINSQIHHSWSQHQEVYLWHVLSGKGAHLWGVMLQADEAADGGHLPIGSSHRFLRHIEDWPRAVPRSTVPLPVCLHLQPLHLEEMWPPITFLRTNLILGPHRCQ